MTTATATGAGPGNRGGEAVLLSTALQLVLEDLREREPRRYDDLGDVTAYHEWLTDGCTVAEIDEAQRGRQLDAELADAYRVVLTAGYGPVMTVLLDLDPTGAVAGARLVVTS